MFQAFIPGPARSLELYIFKKNFQMVDVPVVASHWFPAPDEILARMDVLLSEYLFSLLCMILNIAGSPIPFHKVPPTTGSCIWPMLPKILDHIAELGVLLKVIYPCPKTFYAFPSWGFGEGNGNPLQYSCLENPVDRAAWWAAVHRVAQSRTQLKQLSMHACIGEGNGRDRGAWWAAVYGVAQGRTRLKQLSSSSSSMVVSF